MAAASGCLFASPNRNQPAKLAALRFHPVESLTLHHVENPLFTRHAARAVGQSGVTGPRKAEGAHAASLGLSCLYARRAHDGDGRRVESDDAARLAAVPPARLLAPDEGGDPRQLGPDGAGGCPGGHARALPPLWSCPRTAPRWTRAARAEACYSRAPAEERQTGHLREVGYAICQAAAPTSPSRISPIAGPKRRWLPSYPKSARNRPPDRDRARLRLPDRKWGSARVLEGRIVYSVRPGPNHVQRPSRFGQGHTCRTTFSGLMRPGMTSVYGFARRA